VLGQDPGGQVAAELVGPVLALLEGLKLVLVGGIEHQVEGGGGVAEPAAA
jgi:hypothetical protein